MRVAFVALVVGVLVLVGAASYATSLPDLPGMGSAQRAIEGKTASGSRSGNAPAPTASAAPAPQGGSQSSSSVKPSSAGSIMKLPGTGSIPAISDLASHRSALPRTDTLLLLAAIGTATALGMLWAVRRRYEA
jgi:hypothetical protein